MAHLDLKTVDTDGAIREGAATVAGDTRLAFLHKGALAAGAALGGGTILSTLMPGTALAKGRPPASFGKGDIGIMNYALTLEYLESAFYDEATRSGKITDPALKAFLATTTRDERAHVKLFQSALGSKAIKKPKFDFMGIPSDPAKFAATAYVLENTGVHAFLGQASNIKAPKLLLMAASIVTVEARHSGAIGLYLSKSIAPNGPFDSGLTATEVLKLVQKTGFVRS